MIQTLGGRLHSLLRSTAALLVLCAPIVQAQTGRPTEAELADITARGRALAAYDFAAWHGTDAIGPLNPAPGTITRYIARQTPDGWTVAFGTVTASRDTFLVAYEAVRRSTSGAFEGFTGVSHAKPLVEVVKHRDAAAAFPNVFEIAGNRHQLVVKGARVDVREDVDFSHAVRASDRGR